ncbi:hypothetical protein [Altibacter sp.]|uniref:dioxygenase family protein n=1 Tax=Altibacter sp. TaxID=2024823 RepID=UPI000C8B2912|nr:hypothetical protein [Altibacter sp.]MAP55579.1 intradiol ring-cleavage dioxygenase [Altibacter sp.]
MKYYSFLLLLCCCFGCAESGSKAQTDSTPTVSQSRSALPDCEWCGAMDAPKDLSWSTRIADASEPGEPLVLSGTVYLPDGKTPASNVLVYAYHTNAEGIYPKRGDETGNGQRHGYLRAWVRTNAEGAYRFETIRPEAYPSRSEPAHMHLTVAHDSIPEYWLNATQFQGDPLLPKTLPPLTERDGGYPSTIKLIKDAQGVWQGTRDIILRSATD